MLRFIIGRAGSGKTTKCIEEIAQKIVENPLGLPLILLAPAHLTYQLEKNLAEKLKNNGHGFVRAQIFSFSRLARHILLETGGAVCPRITTIGKRLLLKKILTKRGKELKAFSKAVRQRGFAANLEEAIVEFKSYKITPENLKAAATMADDERLRDKIDDLSLLYREFSSQMEGIYTDSEDILDALAGYISSSLYLSGAEIWIDGFAYFNPQELKIITELLKVAKNVKVSLLMDTENELLNKTETGLFHNAWEMAESLTVIANDLGIEIERETLRDIRRFKSIGYASVERGLFNGMKKNLPADGIHLIEAVNRRREIEIIAADMRRLCRDKGYRWKEIGILFRNPEDYGTIPEMVLRDYGVPFFCDFKRAGVHHPLAELIRSLFDVFRRWQYEAIFRSLRTGFFPITRDEIDTLENYVLRFGINDNKWIQSDDWNWVKRYDELENDNFFISEAEQADLDKINILRRKVSSPFEAVKERYRKAANVREKIEAVYEFLQILNVPEQLEKMAIESEKAGRLADAEMHQQIWDDIIDLFEQIVILCGEEIMTDKEFEAIVLEGLDSLSIAIIPPGLDYVTISSFDRNSLSGIRALYIAGANEGIMPRYIKEKGLLSDADRLHLLKADVRLPQGARKSSFSEANIIYRGFTTGSEYLWISYPLSDAEGKGLKESIYVNKLKEIMPELQKITVGLDTVYGDDMSLQIAEKRQATAALAPILRHFRERGGKLGFWQDVYNYAINDETLGSLFDKVHQGMWCNANNEILPRELAARLYVKRDRILKASISRFECFQQCPFRHFANYGLKLRERDEYKLKASNYGTFLHAIMAKFGNELKTEGKKWADISNKECHERCVRITELLAPKLMSEIFYSNAQKKNLLKRIEKMAEQSINRLIEFDSVSSFSPVYFEKTFGLGLNSEVPLSFSLEDGFILEVGGKIDRIDRSADGKYFLVVDYKTGEEKINLNEVYDGVKMQLLTYLLFAKTLAEIGGISAGVLYCYLRNVTIHETVRISHENIESKMRDKLKMPGWILEEPEVIKLLDESGNYIKVKLTKEGKVNKVGKNTRTQEDFDILLEYMEWLLRDTGNKILDGDIKVLPYADKEKSCRFCPYKAVCRFDKSVYGYEEKVMLREKDESAIFEMMKKKEGGEADGLDC